MAKKFNDGRGYTRSSNLAQDENVSGTSKGGVDPEENQSWAKRNVWKLVLSGGTAAAIAYYLNMLPETVKQEMIKAITGSR